MGIKKIIYILLLLLTLAACNESLQMTVKSDVPVPLAKQYPLSVGIYFTDEFRNFVYKENSFDRPDWSIETGQSQVQLFRQVLPSLFQSIQEVDSVKAASVTAIFKPEVEEVQFALPKETKTELYEVWVKYRIQLFDNAGMIIADWPFIGYGKSSTEFFKSKDKGLNDAFSQALRDAGARFVLNFEKNNDLKSWLKKSGVCSHRVSYC